ncbi:MAG TPA: calcium-binding protein [Solirubrobacterales bacterium]|nr:calcium-binding protein [Solirubrobacterales bacterium]
MFRSSKLAALLVATASFAPLAIPVAAGAAVTSDVQGNALNVTSTAADQIILSVVNNKIAVNGVATALDAGPNAQIVVNAGGEADTVDASALAAASYGALTINGEAGEDKLTGGGGNDIINGGDDVDELRGGDGNDTLTAGKGNETIVKGGDGADTMIWNNGEGSDVNDGEAGTDTVLSNGNDAAGEIYTYEAGAPGRVVFKRVTPGPFSIDLEAELLVVNGLGGADSFSPANATPIDGRTLLTVNGGAGADTITGADGGDVLNGGDDVDELRGGDGQDTLTGGKGNELVISGGAGNDRMFWNPGDGNDVNDGGEGEDIVASIGAAAGETYSYEAKPQGRVLLKRTAGAPEFTIDFAAEHLEASLEDGDDTIAPVGTGLADLKFSGDGGNGNDRIVGAEGIDILIGSAGNDTLIGGKDEDAANGGSDDDTMIWNNGDGSDRNIGGNGNDVSIVNGSDAANEVFTYGPEVAAARVRLDRAPNAQGAGAFGITLEAESLVINSLGGNDKFDPAAAGIGGRTTITVNAGAGNDTVTGGDGVDVQNGDAGSDTLVGGKGGDVANGGDGDDTMIWNNGDGTDKNTGDAGVDTVVSNGNDAANEVYTYGPRAEAGRVQLNRLPNAQGAGAFGIDLSAERLIVNGLAGDDKFSPAAAGLAGRTALTINAGGGNDTVTGGDGVDDLHGDGGNDMLFSRDGVADFVHGDAGTDSAQTDALTLDKVDGVEKIDALGQDRKALLPRLGKAKVTMVGKRLVARLPLTCPVAETGGCKVRVTLKTAKAVRIGKKKRTVVLGSTSAKLAAGAITTVRIPLNKRAATLAKGGKLVVKALITSTDSAGNKAKATKKLALKVPRAKK